MFEENHITAEHYFCTTRHLLRSTVKILGLNFAIKQTGFIYLFILCLYICWISCFPHSNISHFPRAVIAGGSREASALNPELPQQQNLDSGEGLKNNK